MRLDARNHLVLTMAVTATALAAAFLLPLPAMAGGNSVDGSGHASAANRAVGAFTSLRVEGPLDVRAHPGTVGSVVVRADDNVLPMIETVVEGQTLVLRLAPHANFRTWNHMTVDVPFARLDTLQIRGSGDVSIVDLTATRFEASISGSGDLNLQRASIGALVADIAGSGDITLSGRADEARYAIAGSGDLHARELQAKRVNVSISGSGDADVFASEALDAHVSGSGDIRYGGHPTQVNTHVAGSGDIDPN